VHPENALHRVQEVRSVEHRRGARTPTDLRAEVCNKERRLGFFAVRNISANGLCIECEEGELHPRDFLHICIRPAAGSGLETCAVHAMVVWIAGRLAGLMRADTDPHYLKVFSRLVELSHRDQALCAGGAPARRISQAQWREVAALGGVSCEDCATHRFCLVRRLETAQPGEIGRLIRHPRPFGEGERLILQGERYSFLYLVQSGSFKSGVDGGPRGYRVTGFHFPGEILGLDGLDTGRHSYEVRALEPATVCALPYDLVDCVAARDRGALCRHLFGVLLGVARREGALLMQLVGKGAARRLAIFILHLSERMEFAGKSPAEFELSMGRGDVASYLAIDPAQLDALFRRLEGEGLIRVRGRRLAVRNPDGLRELAAA
jgi:CRP/FNR family transcriptional regulator